jgi:nicotinamide-nucleotide amidase
MNACILSIGDELTSGLTTNTNCSWLSGQLATLGINTTTQVTVGDELDVIVRSIRELVRQCGILLISGGLGPTVDDLTREALAQAMDDTLVQDEQALADLTTWFAARARPMSPSNLVQAQRPSKATCLRNPHGTAPGLRAMAGQCVIYVMPGVPREMRQMFTQSVLPDLQLLAGDRVVLNAKLNTFGMGESVLGERIKDLMARGANPSVGTSVHDGIVSVRVYATGTKAEAAAMVESTKVRVRQRVQELCFGEGEESLEDAVAKLLQEQRQTIATAESCTGGLLAKLLTDVPGSSTYFLRGWVTYSNQAKTEDIGVPADLITRHGAVSQEVALAMADGARRTGHTDWGVGITGIAGPGGGSVEKPVGLVWIALASSGGTAARSFIFPGEREQIRLRAAQMALALLRWKILGVDADTFIRPVPPISDGAKNSVQSR